MTSPATSTRWVTLQQLAERCHVRPRTAWRLVRPYREACHLGRNGPHPRLVLWIPFEVVLLIEEERARLAR